LFWLRSRGVRVRDGKGNRAEAEEESAEEPAGFAIGNAVLEEGIEDGEDLGRDFGGGQPGEVAAEVGPASDAGIAIAFGEGWRAGDGGFGSVVAAERLVAGGGGAAFAAGGQDVGAFAGHGVPPVGSGPWSVVREQ
jgi:hypothetical protein